MRRLVAEGFDILSFGRINWKKGLDRLIRSAAEMQRVKVLIAGHDEDGLARNLRKLVIEQVDGVYRVLPSHPSLRLWQDSHERLLRNEPEGASGLAYTSKVRLVAGTRLTHCDEPRPLRTAYFLGNGSATEITFRRLTATETLLAWAKHRFCWT